MRRVYEKPSLFAESYTLVEHISQGCALETGTYTPGFSNAWVCPVTDAGGTKLFMDGTDRCSGGEEIDPNLEDIDSIVSAITGGQCYNSVVSGPMFSS